MRQVTEDGTTYDIFKARRVFFPFRPLLCFLLVCGLRAELRLEPPAADPRRGQRPSWSQLWTDPHLERAGQEESGAFQTNRQAGEKIFLGITSTTPTAVTSKGLLQTNLQAGLAKISELHEVVVFGTHKKNPVSSLLVSNLLREAGCIFSPLLSHVNFCVPLQAAGAVSELQESMSMCRGLVSKQQQ